MWQIHKHLTARTQTQTRTDSHTRPQEIHTHTNGCGAGELNDVIFISHSFGVCYSILLLLLLLPPLLIHLFTLLYIVSNICCFVHDAESFTCYLLSDPVLFKKYLWIFENMKYKEKYINESACANRYSTLHSVEA